MTAEVEAKDELIKSQAATIRQLQSDNDAKERELKDLRGRLFACPTTEQIKAQTKKHILGAMVYPNNVQLQKIIRKQISLQDGKGQPPVVRVLCISKAVWEAISQDIAGDVLPVSKLESFF